MTGSRVRIRVLASTAAAALLLSACGAMTVHSDAGRGSRTTARESTQRVPAPPVVVVGTLVAASRGLRFGTPVSAQGAPCALGVCWSTLVTARGYLYPVEGSYDYPVSDAITIPWHIAGPVLAGPGVNPRDHFIFADPRSASRALIWIGPNTFVSTHDGGRHWYRVSGITHRVAIVDSGGQLSSITVGIPGLHACDYYFTYSSAAGRVWRRGGALENFMTTALAPQTPSCLANAHL